MSNKTVRECLGIVYLLAAIVALSGCDSTSQVDLIEDAKTFCDLHDKSYWTDADNDLSIDQLEKLIAKRVSEEIKTEQFKALVEELQSVNYYRDLYPTAKERIERLTGNPWVCSPYEHFYSVSVEAIDPVADQEVELTPDIVVQRSGVVLLGGEKLDFDSDQLKNFLASRGAEKRIVVLLKRGVDDAQLQPLFKTFAKFKVENISVINE